MTFDLFMLCHSFPLTDELLYPLLMFIQQFLAKLLADVEKRLNHLRIEFPLQLQINRSTFLLLHLPVLNKYMLLLRCKCTTLACTTLSRNK